MANLKSTPFIVRNGWIRCRNCRAKVVPDNAAWRRYAEQHVWSDTCSLSCRAALAAGTCPAIPTPETVKE